MLTPVSNSAGLTRWLQAQPLCLLSLAPIGSFLPEESALLGPLTWSSYWPPLPVLTVVIVAQSSGHRCSPICGLRAALNPLASRSRFALSIVSVLLSTLYTITPTTQGVSIRSFTRSGTDRPFRPICSSPSADFQNSLRSIPNHLTHVLHTSLPSGFETNLLRASLHDAAASKVHLHSLVDPSLLESSDVGYSFAWTTCRLPPKDTQQYAVQNRIQTGCKREANETHVGSHTHSPNRQRQSGV